MRWILTSAGTNGGSKKGDLMRGRTAPPAQRKRFVVRFQNFLFVCALCFFFGFFLMGICF
jgi:hypothetical protein